MAAISNVLGNAIATRFLAEAGSVDSPSVIAIGLATAAPSSDADDAGDAGTEVANSNGYARVSTDPSSEWSNDGDGTISNSAAITFPEATGSWGTVTHVIAWDSATYGAGNMLFYGTLTTSKSPNTPDTPTIQIGELTVNLNSN